MYACRMEPFVNKWFSTSIALGIDELRKGGLKVKMIVIHTQSLQLVLMMRP